MPKVSPSTTAQAAWAAIIALTPKTHAEDRADYRYELYSEDNDRIQIRTQGFWFDKGISPWMSLKGNFIYDSISGATPTGAPPIPTGPDRRDPDVNPGEITPGSFPPPPNNGPVRTVEIDDIRRAGYLQPTFLWKNHTISPQAAVSIESDYESFGAALSDAIDFNNKNTTVSWGVSFTPDRVLDAPQNPDGTGKEREWVYKNTTDFFVGVTQLLNPETIVTFNLTLGYTDGYLNDPYKRVVFEDYNYYYEGDAYNEHPESRPHHKFRQVAYTSINHFVDKLDGAVEASYRFSHDDYGIFAHTVSLQWHQKIKEWAVISPLFRFHNQSAADFYGVSFPGDGEPGHIDIPNWNPIFGPEPRPEPDYYSADYRLSALNSITYGVGLSLKPFDWGSLELAYKRYEMSGNDNITSSAQYPDANVYTAGITLWF